MKKTYTIQFFFFFQAEDGIRDSSVTGVQTCALPIYLATSRRARPPANKRNRQRVQHPARVIGRASCRERVEISVVAVSLKKKKVRNAVTKVPGKTDRACRGECAGCSRVAGRLRL